MHYRAVTYQAFISKLIFFNVNNSVELVIVTMINQKTPLILPTLMHSKVFQLGCLKEF